MEVSTEMQGEIAVLRALDSVAHTGNGGNAGEDAAILLNLAMDDWPATQRTSWEGFSTGTERSMTAFIKLTNRGIRA